MEGKKVVDRQEIELFLTENALKCFEGMEIISLSERNMIISVNLANLIKVYGEKNIYNHYGEVIGVYFEKEYYALPETKKNISKLVEFGFIKDPNFFFYLNENEHPKDATLSARWNSIKMRGCKEREEEFTQECKRWAKINGIKPVPNTELANCFLIPDSGFVVRDIGDEYDGRVCRPLVSYLDPQTISEVGLYASCDNRTMFVNYDGKTYMAKGNHIEKLLKSLNYRELYYFLPLLENEVIVDEKLQLEWEKIPEVNDPEEAEKKE